MTTYHHAPHTLDPDKELPDQEEVAPAAGHDGQMAEEVRELQEEHKQGVQEAEQLAQERQEEGVPEPPYEAGHEGGTPPEEQGEDVPETTPEAQPAEGGSSQGPPEGTINEVLDWVGDDQDRARQALEAERDGQNRQTLISELEKRAGG